MHEFELINNYLKKIAKNKNSLNLSDDVFFDRIKGLVISVDTYVEGNHFIDFKKPELVIKKIIRSSISDLLSKGVKPKYYFISVSGNKKAFTKKNLKKISKSLDDEQKKYKLALGGGDTVFSNKLSFTITSIGFAKKIVFRNKAKIYDDIYISGNIGDSYLGLLILKNNLKISNFKKKYFINKYYKPDLYMKLSKNLNSLASSSIDISDGLFADLEKLLNKNNLTYKVFLNKIPISKNLSKFLNARNLKKINYISKGDDYQILFTASKNNRSKIVKFSKKNRIRITRIGKILNRKDRSIIIDDNLKPITLKNKGYLHRF